MYYIYKITCVNNGNVYIGSTNHLAARFGAHLSLLKKKKHFNKKLQDDYNLFGKNCLALNIIYHSNDENKLKVEKEYIGLYLRYCEVYNVMIHKADFPILLNRVKEKCIRDKVFVDKETGLLLMNHRLKAKRSRFALAKEAGCSAQYLSRVENGDIVISHKTALNISMAYKIDLMPKGQILKESIIK